jgi:sucrose-phosphate synthase
LGDHDPCLDDFRQQQRVYFASRSQLPGVLEGIQY